MPESVLSAMDAAVVEAAVAVGFDRAALLLAWGGDPAVLADPDARVPLSQHLALWAHLSREPRGLEIGARLGVSGMGVVGYAMQHEATVREALAWLERFRAVVHPGVVPTLSLRDAPQGALMVLSRPVPPPFAALREPVYAQAASVLSVLRTLAGDAIRVRFVAYPLPRPTNPERHERWFAAPVSWGGPMLEIAFDATLLDRPLRRADPRLHGYLAARAAELLAKLPAEDDTCGRVRHEIATLLARGEPRIGAVASRLALSARTLNRRLADADTSFSALLAEVRRARAEMLLQDRSLSCSEIAFLLGYAEPAAFTRAYRRWTGRTPQAARALPG
ncbi:MAG: AraC family transcriptional regulator [Gemmatimonadaceae bacterium]|nr:AraC family transcriptional regulator [Gemmatimonadaceae bacterium]